jgi:histone acetyltransferase
VQDPVDLTLMGRRLKARDYYLTLDIFAADFKRMINNCKTYNSPDTMYYKLANQLGAKFEAYLSTHIIHFIPHVTASA